MSKIVCFLIGIVAKLSMSFKMLQYGTGGTLEAMIRLIGRSQVYIDHRYHSEMSKTAIPVKSGLQN